MDQNNNQEVNNEIQYPFQPMLSEDQFHLYEDIKVKLIGQNGKEIEFAPISGFVGIILDKIMNHKNKFNKKHKMKIEGNTSLISNINGKSFMFNYEILVSHGQQGDQFMCFLGSQEEEEIELEEDQEVLMELIQQQIPADILNLGKGEYQVQTDYEIDIFDLSKLSKDIQIKINQIFTELASANVEMEEEAG